MRRGKEAASEVDMEQALKAIKNPDFIAALDLELKQLKRDREENIRGRVPNGIRLRPGSYSTYDLQRRAHETGTFGAQVPEWMHTAVLKVVNLGLKEKACLLPGDPADLDHGHLELPKNLGRISRKRVIMEARGVLFHAQECIDGVYYGLDPRKRNLYYDRDTGEASVLDITKFLTTSEFGIHHGRKDLDSGCDFSFKWIEEDGQVKLKFQV